jgi:hypothetical protein
MARQKAVETHIEVSRGFATEVNPVVATPEVLVDIDNCIIARDGTIRRRLGVELEVGFSTNLINGAALGLGELDTIAFATDLWTSVANIGSFNIVVQQIGAVLQFFSQVGALSSNFLGELDLAVHTVDLSLMVVTPMQLTSGLGKLFVVNPYMEPVVITFDEGTFLVETTTLQQRDFEGLDDGLAIDERPDLLTKLHYYNLRNQGWSDENINIFAGRASTTNLCTGTTGTGLAADSSKDWPSNSDIMTVGIVVNSSGDLEFDPEFIREDFLGNTPAPKGHFILDAFNKDYSAALNCSGIDTAVTTTRPEAIAFHQGRIFYAAPPGRAVGNGIFYSQQLLADDRRGKCFQEADSTAAEVNDLVATDGGYLPTPGIGQVYRLQEMSNGIVVFASNGVWYLTGAEIGSAVTGTSLRLDKVYSSGVLGAASIVEAEGNIYFFSEEGIMKANITIEGVKIENISKSSIQRFYTAIDTAARAKTVSVFIPTERKIFWAYSSPAVASSSLDKLLILDLDVGGYYKYSIQYDDVQVYPQIIGVSKVAPLARNTTVATVITTNGIPVTTSDGVTLVTANIIVDSSQTPELKLATLVEDTGLGGHLSTFATFDRGNFRDWTSSTVTGLGLPMVSSIDFAQTAMGAVHTNGRPTHVNTYYSKSSKNVPGIRTLTTAGALGCSTGVNLVLLIDISNSMVASGFLTSDIKPGIKGLITDLLSSVSGISIALDGFSTDTANFAGFTDNEATLHAAVDTAYADPIAAQATALGLGIDLAATTLTGATGFKSQVIFIVTDGVGNIPTGSGLQAGVDSAAALTNTEIYVGGIGGRDGFNDLYLETYIATTPAHYSQIDDYDEMIVELAKVATCPSQVPVPVDYLNTTFATNWKMSTTTLDVSNKRVEWIQDFGLYVLVSEAFAQFDTTNIECIHTSPDGITWTARDVALKTAALGDVAYSSALGLAVAVGVQDPFEGFGAIKGFRTSTDGITWVETSAPTDAFYYGVMWSAAKSLFIASGDDGIFSSTDGVTWVNRESGDAFDKVAYADSLGLFAAPTRNGDDVYTSSDGITWAITAAALPQNSFRDITWSESLGNFAAISVVNSLSQGVAHSSNGTTWTVATVVGDGEKGRRSVKWFPVEGKFISVDDGDNAHNIISSTDGITWIEETALTEWPAGTTLVDITRKSATEWVVIRESGMVAFRSIAAPF